jgi:hypothetical protein
MIRKHFKSICMKFLGVLVQLVPGWIFRHNGFCLALSMIPYRGGISS